MPKQQGDRLWEGQEAAAILQGFSNDPNIEP